MLKHYILATRPNHLFISIAPILLCFSYAKSMYGHIKIIPFILVCISELLFHIAVNTIADYRDFKNEIDTTDSLGSSGMITVGLVNPQYIFFIGILSFILASIIGIIVSFISGGILFFIGIISAAFCFFYSEWPIKYKYRCCGEIGVFVVWGPLLFSACSFSMLGYIDQNILKLSIISGILTTIILLSNNLRDYEYDKTRNNTLITKIGLKNGYIILFSLIISVYGLHSYYIHSCVLPSCKLAILSCIFAFIAMKYINKKIFVEHFVWLNLSYCTILSCELFTKT